MRYGTIIFNASAENDNGSSSRSINYISISHCQKKVSSLIHIVPI